MNEVRYISKKGQKVLASDQTSYNIAMTRYIILRNMLLDIAAHVHAASNTT
jgi:hypothetical protein